MLTFTASRQWLINSGLFALLKGQAGRGSSEEVSVSGKAGRRLRIKRPETFLNEVLLASSSARSWLASRLSVSRAMYYRSQAGLSKLPHVWMVTGVQYITDAYVTNGRTRHQTASASVNVPMPEPLSAMATVIGVQEGVSGGFEVDNTSGTTMSYHHKDERVWAAQFSQLSLKFTPKPKSADDLPNQIPLLDLIDIKLGAVRAGVPSSDISLSQESAEISGLEDDDSQQSSSDEILKRMQDVDWGTLHTFLAEIPQDKSP